ncbi:MULTISPECIES: DUF3726 domain-containing protein [unclassified Leisingera]|uniref:DUF3726 domain-containing protein n=1 Tax=unclassified Leisingera TaxID=2614906 RepID=UPI0003028CA3|nr:MULTISPECIES: DUF3726 domain-containing protein [unclassified Leisingera]KIC23030.1 hypothetical protein RA23_16530 [Leisingera sp. ANG-S3]KIC52388.1 hypothetical protein RA22_16015 [Leisingera sp. ANG-S]KID07406.1 hypothetical protein GC1_19270 [Leisingera sp. ANG1]
MSYALNEVEATAKRAARGAGYDWGLAEEAAKATRWLCAQGLDGSDVLAGLLEAGYAVDLSAHVPQGLQAEWQAAAPLCPLVTGAALSDCAARLQAAPLAIGPVSQPAMILPFAAMAARRLAVCVTVEGEGFQAVTDGTGLQCEGTLPNEAARLTIRAAGSLSNPYPTCTRAEPEEAAWAVLNRFAHKTYAPATEESRRLGAGAGLSDND